MRDLLFNPPTDHPYVVLKEQLTKRTSLSEQRKLQQLLTGKELGDRKPTQLLRRMKQLLGDRSGIDASFFGQLFLQRLPHNVRIVLASTPDSATLDELAEMADKIAEVAAPSVAAVHTPPATPLTAEVDSLRAEVSGLEKLMQQLSRPSRLFNHRSPHRSPRRSPTPPTSPTSAVFIASLVTTPGVVVPLAPGRETPRPVTSGDQCRRPRTPWSPFSCA